MGEIQARIRALSPRVELMVVVLTAFGWFTYDSLRVVAVLVTTGGSMQWAPSTEAELIELLRFEVIVLVILGWFLRVRGWTPAHLGLDPSWGGGAHGFGLGVVLRTLQGVALALAVAFVYQFAVSAMWATLGQRVSLTDAALTETQLSLATILAVCIINSIFEELFLCGYLITRLGDMRGMWFAINVSVAIRLTYHLYQGSAGVPSIIAAGLIFGYWFARTRQLWPPIVAHGSLNLIAFTSLE
jgi:membrane protease YdiL (CAAX protease family)